MPEQGGQSEWAIVNAGIKEHWDISPDKLDKVDALKLLHRFVLHTPLKPVGEEKMRDYWDIIKASLSEAEIAAITAEHNANEHNF